jgi:hypothetical protein
MIRMTLLRIAGIALLLALTGIVYTGATASNTIPTTRVGSGSGTVTPYTFSNLIYIHNVNSPQQIQTVNFTISPTDAAFVKIQLTATGAWYTCTNSAGNVNCATSSPQALASAPDQLTIVASS